MASIVANYAAKKLIGGQMEKYRSKKVAGDDDPYFTMVTGRNGKPKKVKKQIPDYIPKHDAEVLAHAKKRAYSLDCSLFTLFGVRFGWSSVIGIIPEIGDVIDMYFAVKVVNRCKQVEGGLPAGILSQMWMNVILDFVVGLVPFLGDLLDAAFRCNTKNVALLEKHLKEKYGPKDPVARETSGLEAFEDDHDPPPYGSHENDTQQYGTTTTQNSHQAPHPSDRQTGHVQQKQQNYQPQQQPRQQSQQPNTRGFGWFSRSKQPDVENRQDTGSIQA